MAKTWEKTVMSDEQIEVVYNKAYKKLCEYSEKYPMGLSAKNFHPQRPADRQRYFNSAHREYLQREIAKAQAEITGKIAYQEGIRKVVEWVEKHSQFLPFSLEWQAFKKEIEEE